MVMAGLEQPDTGSVRLPGRTLRQLGEDGLARFRGKNVGIVFQAFHLIPTMTALENVAVPLEFAGERDAFDACRAELAAVGLAERLHHYPAELSGGEQQRVASLARSRPSPQSCLPTSRPAISTERRGTKSSSSCSAVSRARHNTGARHSRYRSRCAMRSRAAYALRPDRSSNVVSRGDSAMTALADAAIVSRNNAAGGGTAQLALRYAWRELRGGLRGFGVFIVCIALGVFAIAGVGSVAASLADGIGGAGQLLLGGDLSFR